MLISQKSLLERLQSILFDAKFVQQCAKDLGLPVVANQRCGSWYVPPDLLAHSCYFKSTDGHVNEWSFNHRRLNLHLLPLIEASGGCIIVDSTRGPKSFPDALSKTIPIWCCVLNRLLFPNHKESQLSVLPSSKIISPDEIEAIRNRLPSLCSEAERLDLDISSLRTQISRPLRPYFLDPSSNSVLALNENTNSENHPIFLVMASSNEESSESRQQYNRFRDSILPYLNYVRGAGDDEDNWASGITPEAFWHNKDALLEALQDPDIDYPATILSIANIKPKALQYEKPIGMGQPGLFIGTTTAHVSYKILQTYAPYDAIIVCNEDHQLSSNVETLAKEGIKPPILDLKLTPGKLGSRALRAIFPQLMPFMAQITKPKPAVLVADNAGIDHAAGVTLILSCLFYEEDCFSRVPVRHKFDKEFIRKRLAMMTACKWDINPSRATLQSVNALLMPWDEMEAISGMYRGMGQMRIGE